MDKGTPASVSVERSRMQRKMTVLGVANLLGLLTVLIMANLFTSLVTDAQIWRILLPTGIVLAGCTPLMLLMRHHGRAMSRDIDRLAGERERQLDIEARRRDFDAQVADALDMADSEQEALRVVERAFAAVAPHQSVELLLADNSHSHLERKASTSTEGETPGCPVAAPLDCPAARRARVQKFTDAEALNACPKLAGRMPAGSAAVCLPVSVMGRAAGVIHTIGPADIAAGSGVVSQLGSIARQVGARMAMLRALAETQLQASTDSLTGLLNRRAFENSWQSTLDSTTVVAMADLDHFKELNDTHGHDTGDRALRTFANILRSTLRERDVVSRRGGEEFAIAFSDCDAATAVACLQRVQQRLRTALAAGALPAFTASFGVVESIPGEELCGVLERADAALFAAKRAGRDRVVIHDALGRVQLHVASAFSDSTPPPEPVSYPEPTTVTSAAE